MAEATVQNPLSLIQQINIQISPKCCSLELALSHVESWVTFRRTVHPRFPVNISPVIVVALENEDLTQDMWQRIRGRIPQYVNVMGVLSLGFTTHCQASAGTKKTPTPGWRDFEYIE